MKVGSGERYVILAVERDGLARPMSMNLVLREGDVASVAIHLPEKAEALEALGPLGWRPSEGPEIA